MSKQLHLEINAHNSIYKSNFSENNYQNRKMLVTLGIPENGTNPETGMLVLIPGYGGTIHSHVWRKMSAELSDEYNLIVMQCDYFGNRFMDNIIPDNIPKQLLSEFSSLPNFMKGSFVFSKEYPETKDEFNDMGIMQALDTVNATLNCILWVSENKLHLNTNRIFLFGSSHGAYIAHLANLICPDLYTYLIDISAYSTPFYLDKTRLLSQMPFPKCNLDLVMSYFITRFPQYQYNKNLYDLHFLYKHSDNHCKIIAFQGTQDQMVDYHEKAALLKEIGSTAQLMLISPKDVDGILCKNAAHGLGIDFFELFKMLMPLLDATITEQSMQFNLQKEISLGDSNASLRISYEHYFPELLHITFDN